MSDALNEEFHEAFKRILRELANKLREAARYVLEADQLGIDISMYDAPIGLLRLLGKGILVDEAADLILNRPKLARRLSHLPPSVQTLLLAGTEKVRVVLNDAGERGTFLIRQLPFELYGQVFAGERLRTDVEQIAYRASRKPREKDPEPEIRGGWLVVGKNRVRLAVVEKLLALHDRPLRK